MKNEKIVGVQFKPGRKHCLFALVAAFLCFHPRPLGSETLTLSTYYPAPYGGYVAILTTGGTTENPVNTVLARDGGKVGIGTVSPASKLSVSGGIQIGDDSSTCTANKGGTLRWNAGVVEVCDASCSHPYSPHSGKQPPGAWVPEYPPPGAVEVVEVCDAPVWKASSISLPDCNNAGYPEDSSNRPCNAPIYRCPLSFVPYSQCTGQLQMTPFCYIGATPAPIACTVKGTTPL